MTALDRRSTADVLEHGTLEIVGRLVDASNATLKCVAELDGVTLECVYKPRRGERPLWDFTSGTLGYREVAAYLISEAAEWALVPTTTWRETGPLGEGMCQLWVEADDDAALVDLVPVGDAPEAWRIIVEAEDAVGQRVQLVHADDPMLRLLAAFDVVVNNADRKGGHVLVEAGSSTPQRPQVIGIDHGVCFHDEYKLRTVLWGWAGESLDDEVRAGLDRLSGALDDQEQLHFLLSGREMRALADRITELRVDDCYPFPGGDWPPLPWPVF